MTIRNGVPDAEETIWFILLLTKSISAFTLRQRVLMNSRMSYLSMSAQGNMERVEAGFGIACRVERGRAFGPPLKTKSGRWVSRYSISVSIQTPLPLFIVCMDYCHMLAWMLFTPASRSSQAHAFEDGREPWGTAQRVPFRIDSDKDHTSISFFVGLLQPPQSLARVT